MSDTPTDHTADGPADTEAAKTVKRLRDAVSAVGPLNVLPDRLSEDDLASLEAATLVIERLLDERGMASSELER